MSEARPMDEDITVSSGNYSTGSSSNDDSSDDESSSSDDSSDESSDYSTSRTNSDDDSLEESIDADDDMEGQEKSKKLELEPYIEKLERFELFSTAQAYYLVGSDKEGIAFRVLVFDRTRMLSASSSSAAATTASNHGSHESHTDQQQPQQQQQQQQFQRLGEFCREDPTVYTSEEIRNVLDMIHDGNTVDPDKKKHSSSSGSSDSGLKPIGKAFGIVGFIRFLDCYYLTLITKRAKVGCIGGNDIYSIRQTETFPLKPAEKRTASFNPTSRWDNPSTNTNTNMQYYNNINSPKQSPTDQSAFSSSSYYNASQNNTSAYYNNNTNQHGKSNKASDTNSSNNDPSSVLLNMWNRGKRSVGLGFSNSEMAELRYQGLYQVMDLTKNNFFFSYTYDVTKSLQDNFLAMNSQPFPPPPFQEMYAWNYFLTRELEEEDIISKDTQHYWVLPIIHGAFVQRTIQDYGQRLNITLLARRSRHFAGTRYLKRGVSDRGKVANDVEHEQIMLHINNMTFSSFLQVRGSIPTFWTQETSVTMPKPPIILSRVDPTYHATQLHMEDLLKRYGSPIVILDLVKQSEKREREVIVGNEFRHAIDYLNSHITHDNYKIRYCALDYSHISKHRTLNVSTSLNEAAAWAVNQTGFFCSAPQWKIVEDNQVHPFYDQNPTTTNSTSNSASLLHKTLGIPVFPMEQKGILRTNCIDCLDRTNVAQFSAGVEALGQQLVVTGVRSSAKLDPTSNIVKLLIDMYVEIGDHIALQYGGSEAHKKVQTAGGAVSTINGPMGKHKELLTSIRRYYSNAFTDQAKQDAMNLFLGYYIPSRHAVPLWDMENDYYLHNFHVKEGRGSLQSMTKYQQQYAVCNWNPNSSNCSDSDNDDEQDEIKMDKHQKKSLAVLSSFSGKKNATNNAQTLQLYEDKESRQISRVRRRCQAQNDILSLWWKHAVHQYIQQRMWMQLGRGSSESQLLPRFERLYQPDKLSQFDKLFSRSWATPVRLSHSAQHQASTDDTELLLIRRRVSSHPSKTETSKKPNQSNDKHQSKDNDYFTPSECESNESPILKDYLEEHGFLAATESTLPIFMESKLSRRHQRSARKNWSMNVTYLGDIADKTKPCEEFISYANPIDPNPLAPDFRSKARKEFTKCLHETSLDSDDVAGIQKLSESAHVGSEIRTGPYRGLSQHESAIEVTTVIYEQFDTLGNMQKRGELQSDCLPSVNEDLKRRQMDTPGVLEAVFNGWDRFSAEEKAYSEIMDTTGMSRRRSDVTDGISLSTYCSFFGDSIPLNELEMSYINGTNLTKTKKQSNADRLWMEKGESAFATKAAAMGIPTSSKRNQLPQNSHSLYPKRRNRSIPPGFEQINDDMYARKDNRFMVFNGAGLDSWHGRVPKPKTKVHGIEEDILIR